MGSEGGKCAITHDSFNHPISKSSPMVRKEYFCEEEERVDAWRKAIKDTSKTRMQAAGREESDRTGLMKRRKKKKRKR